VVWAGGGYRKARMSLGSRHARREDWSVEPEDPTPLRWRVDADLTVDASTLSVVLRDLDYLHPTMTHGERGRDVQVSFEVVADSASRATRYVTGRLVLLAVSPTKIRATAASHRSRG
jgi:hypothetical protein